ncbi:MAG: DUF1566 domain-containing protein, partial [Bacteroidales bacterium]|nr:DUF1566 domain-containing protein [Bacteroidales bacterium]
GAHIIKAVAISNSGNKGEDVVSITVKNTFTECANFETFNGSSTELPKGWQAEGWYIDETMGYDDNYSLACETPKAWALTAKTVSENITAIEFYLKGDGTVSFFVDDKEVTCRQSQEWQRYIFYVNEGTHQFKWVYNLGGKMNIDAVSFKKSLAVGMPYQGGIIAYLDETNEHGFIAASEDQSSGIIWAKNNETETSALDKMIGGGKSNTEKIIAALGEGSYAAQLCNDLIIDGYDDWYLPTDCEIDELYINRIIIGNFSSASYWSSLEYVAGKDIFRTMSMKFDELGMKAYGDEREWNHRVRAIRYF